MAKMQNSTRGINVPAIERATGRDWSEWVRLLEASGETNHTAIAAIALAHMLEGVDNPEWWAQSVSIGYEQQAGLRVPGQASTGGYRVSASRTLVGDRDAVIEAWAVLAQQLDFRECEVSAPRQSRTEKRTFWRVDLVGAGRVEVAASEKSPGKTLVALSHNDLAAESDIEPWRAYWKAALAGLVI